MKTEILIQGLHKEGKSGREITRILNNKGIVISRTTTAKKIHKLGLKPNPKSQPKKLKEGWIKRHERDTFERWNNPIKNFDSIEEMKLHFELSGISTLILRGKNGGK